MSDETITHQPTIPDLELPEYHGRQPKGMRSSLTGAGTRLTKPHGIGDRVVLVVEARVKSAAHEETDDGLVYVEKLKVVDLFELDRDPGMRLLTTVRSAYRTAEDAVKGQSPVPDLGDIGYTDGSGVVLTPAEVASLRGDPVRVLLTEQLTPAVIVYADGFRQLWPDDFAKNAPRPALGETVTIGDGEAEVVDLLHHETGESILPRDRSTVDLFPEEGDPFEDGEIDETDPLLDTDGQFTTDTDGPFADGTLPNSEGVDLFDDDEPDTDWEPVTPPRPMLPGEAELAAIEPAPADHEFVARPVIEVRKALADIGDADTMRRFIEAERRGKNRPGMLKSLEARLEQLVGK